MTNQNVFENNESEKKSILNEPYKAVLESKKAGVKIVISAEAEEDTEEGRAEAERRAKLIADHFKIIIGSA